MARGYKIEVKGPLPVDLVLRVSKLHAAAILVEDGPSPSAPADETAKGGAN